ncbi:hypothetical protein M8C21_018490 [Ambrosia artemisiifolia]|uniref:Secreted protein n=1 Tax=Ambrosia artemisiifolia TaxID=4212 RepID=A0AAD5D8P2_AMBAR|nr:hypothetical protein M8C21_018490 [Ambrosia artemisiifolia]
MPAHLTLLFGRPLCCLALIVDRSVQVLRIMLGVDINNEKLLEDHLWNYCRYISYRLLGVVRAQGRPLLKL